LSRDVIGQPADVTDYIAIHRYRRRLAFSKVFGLGDLKYCVWCPGGLKRGLDGSFGVVKIKLADGHRLVLQYLAAGDGERK
jgi:hypothetical protein